MLETVALSISFGGTKAVDGFSMQVPAGSITAIIGPNGAGKTTLYNAISGLLKPEAGQIRLGGRDITGLAPHRIARLGLARTFQDLRLVRRISVLDNVLLACPGQRGESVWGALLRTEDRKSRKVLHDAALAWLARVQLADKSAETTGSLSYGEQKLLSLACCLATDARVLLLDEPVAGLEPHFKELLLERIADLPEVAKTVLFIEHDLAAVRQVARTVIVMDEGRKIAEGTWETVSRDPAVLEAYLA
jgi:ABC-type branched-subunit amino acid transport system ATPase component